MSTCHSNENTAAAMGPAKHPTQAKNVWYNPTLSYLSRFGNLVFAGYH
jgi:hypothetical protein